MSFLDFKVGKCVNIIINGESLRHPLTGIGWYTWNLLQGLMDHKSIDQVVCTPEFKNNLFYKGFLSQTFLKNKIRTFPGIYNFTNYYRNKKFVKKTKYLANKDFIYHEPGYILRPYKGPKICMIHDLSHIKYPGYHPSRRVKFLTENLPNSLVKAEHILTGSDFVRQEIINLFNIPDSKVTRIYHGVSESFKPRNFSETSLVLNKYGLFKKKYLLFVGTLEPRKNLIRLILSFSKLSQQQKQEYPLVVIGVMGWHHSELKKLMISLITAKQLYYLGYVSDFDLPYLYSGAYGFIYLSIYEGFGLPLLEAMASGIPTLAAKGSATHEIIGDSAILVDPFNEKDIYVQLNQLIYNDVLRTQLKCQGLIQSSKFTWKKCIDNTVQLYKKVFYSF